MSTFMNAANKYRRAHWLAKHHLAPLAKLYEMWIYLIHNSFIPASCEIGEGTSFGYKGIGVVVHSRARIGKNCLIAQNVTIGGRSGHEEVPIIGDNCYIGAGAKVLGPFKVGDNSRIAANAVVLSEIPPEATAVGVPARVVRIAGEKVDFAGQVDQIHVTDPVQKELQALNSRLEWLEQLMDEQARSKNL